LLELTLSNYSAMTDPSEGSNPGNNIVRLGRNEQAAIAEELRRYYQDVVDEGVPHHLRALVARFADEPRRAKTARAAAAGPEMVNAASEQRIVWLADVVPRDPK